MSVAIHNHKHQALDRLCQQYKERPKSLDLLTSLVNPLQQIEDELAKLKSDRWLDEAEGLQLDHLGEIVGEQRGNRSDSRFRIAIYARIFINRGGATPEDIITAINLIHKPKFVSYSELYPAAFQIYLQSSNIDSNFKSLIKSIIPAGLRNFVVTYSAEDKPFIFSECSGEVVALETQAILGGDESGAELSTDSGAQSFDVVADTQLFPEGYLGFAEIIIPKFSFSLGDEDAYQVEDGFYLELIPSLDDFKIDGGSKLAEVING